MSADRTVNVLFLCTGNSARSILGEALLNHFGGGRFRGFSAGSHPKGAVHPMALEVLTAAGVDVAGARSKSWDEFAGPAAAPMDIIITVCDNAAGETCPIWPGHPLTAHWGIADPAAVTTPGAAQKAAFTQAMAFMRQRIEALVALPLAETDPGTWQAQLRAIGRLDGATEMAGAE